ncbi:MAG: hypothetical protein RR495_07280 [Anaerovoracaceae bacterium]
MGNIHLNVNVERVDILIAVGVLIMVMIAVVGIFAWLSRSSKQFKVLQNIDRNLEKNLDGQIKDRSDSKVEVTVINNEKDNEYVGFPCEEDFEYTGRRQMRSQRRGKVRAQECSKASSPMECKVEEQLQEDGFDTACKEAPKTNVSKDEGSNEPMLDIAALVAKNQLEFEKESLNREKKDKYSIGKSGRVYTEEELNDLINN